jgi:RNA polymerase sigma factor (sigma-70 family)
MNSNHSFWEDTYHQNIKKLIGIGYRYTTDRALAEDLAHDAFILAYQKVAAFEGKGPFEAWLRRIMVNECLKYLRDQRNNNYLSDYLQNETNTMETDEDLPQDINTEFTEEELLAAINQLPKHHKLVFNLYVIDKYSHAQIAKDLNISEGTSKSHLARARKKIKEILAQKKKKSAIFFALDIDGLYKKRFEQFEMPNTQDFPTESFLKSGISNIPISSTNSFLSKYFTPVVTVCSVGIVSFLLYINYRGTKIEDLAKNNSNETATFSENRINKENNSLTQNADTMINLKKIGLIAATTGILAANLQKNTKTTVTSQADTSKHTLSNTIEKPITITSPQPLSKLEEPSLSSKPLPKLLPNIAAFPYVEKEIYGENSNMTISENELTITAKYPSQKTKKIQKLLGRQIGQDVFTNLVMDGIITLDDKTSFYMKLTKGKLKIEFDRKKNSIKAYQKMKEFGEDLKKMLAEK